MEIHKNMVFIKQRYMMKNDAWKVIVNLHFSPYNHTISKLRNDLFKYRIFKTPLVSVHELDNIEDVLEKLEEQLNAFTEMLPRLDKRRVVLNAVCSMLKWIFVTSTLLDVEELYNTVSQYTLS
jgi:hypothetical protein